MEKLIACTMPGKLGDILYSFHVSRKLAEIHGAKVDFYTSATYFNEVEKLFRYQSFINNVFIPADYVLRNLDMGGQPTQMNVVGVYEKVYQLGYTSLPNKPLHHFIAQSAGIGPDIPLVYEFPDTIDPELPEKYYVVCTRGNTTYNHIYDYLMQHSAVPIVQIGHAGEWQPGNAINRCGLNILDTLPILNKASGFVSIPSAQLVLANGFPKLLKIGMHDNQHWHLAPLVQSPTNVYPVLPSGQQVLDMLNNHQG